MKNKFILSVTICLLLLQGLSSYAQQTIINVPSSEVLPAGDIIFKESNRFRPFTNGGYTTLTPSATFGVGKGFEFSTAVGTYMGSETEIQGDISAKKVWFLGPSTRLSVGGTVSPYLNMGGHPDSFAFAHLSQRIKKTRTSITAGGYMHGIQSFPDKGGVLLGIEQVIIPNKLRLAMDWTSGNDSQGRMGVGLKYRPVSTVSITSAIIIPNKEFENISFNVSVSKFVSIKDLKELKRRL